MKIAVDARFFGPEGTGIGRYLENLLNNLSEIDKNNDYIILLRKANFDLFTPKNDFKYKKILTGAPWYSVKEQVLIPAVLAKEKPDLVHFPQINVPLLWPGKFILTVHDLTPFEFGQRAASKRAMPIFLVKGLGYKVVTTQAIHRATKIIVPSNFVKNKIIEKLKIKEEKIKVTYEGVDFFSKGEKKVDNKKVLAKYSIDTPFVLYVGNTYPYKNVEKIVEALPKINENIKFVCVGKRDSFLEKIIEKAGGLGLNKRMITPGFVPDEELRSFYEEALAFVFPSLSEGFGLPGVEAMSLGCPVISSTSSSLPEIYGDAVLYFDSESEEELAKKVNLLFEDSKKREEFKQLGINQAKKYLWEKMARETLEIYNNESI